MQPPPGGCPGWQLRSGSATLLLGRVAGRPWGARAARKVALAPAPGLFCLQGTCSGLSGLPPWLSDMGPQPGKAQAGAAVRLTAGQWGQRPRPSPCDRAVGPRGKGHAILGARPHREAWWRSLAVEPGQWLHSCRLLCLEACPSLEQPASGPGIGHGAQRGTQRPRRSPALPCRRCWFPDAPQGRQGGSRASGTCPCSVQSRVWRPPSAFRRGTYLRVLQGRLPAGALSQRRGFVDSMKDRRCCRQAARPSGRERAWREGA